MLSGVEMDDMYWEYISGDVNECVWMFDCILSEVNCLKFY